MDNHFGLRSIVHFYIIVHVMRSSSFCISVVLFLLFCRKLNLAKETINPQCTPTNVSGNESAIDFVFLLDHSLGEDKVSRIRYLLKAISCEIPVSKQYRLATVHFPGQSSKVISSSRTNAGKTKLSKFLPPIVINNTLL
ncbi:hypothetical protein OESDEN_18280 [Oesophagostomum dentatum]|uniref:Uncharacterized protein n=1 Tax=Oesophagostomum dentatum TaxID=61180 RepID=A0A0B1SAT5_OESDE|nr:hypothetical protein OESDEN_18280 [Oesophagostomum dentatum]